MLHRASRFCNIVQKVGLNLRQVIFTGLSSTSSFRTQYPAAAPLLIGIFQLTAWDIRARFRPVKRVEHLISTEGTEAKTRMTPSSEIYALNDIMHLHKDYCYGHGSLLVSWLVLCRSRIRTKFFLLQLNLRGCYDKSCKSYRRRQNFGLKLRQWNQQSL